MLGTNNDKLVLVRRWAADSLRREARPDSSEEFDDVKRMFKSAASATSTSEEKCKGYRCGHVQTYLRKTVIDVGIFLILWIGNQKLFNLRSRWYS
jgi:hypothetical protein